MGLSATAEPLLRGCTGFCAFPRGQGQLWGCFVALKEQGEPWGWEWSLCSGTGRFHQSLVGLNVCSSASCLLWPGCELDVWEGKAQGGLTASSCGSAPLRPCPQSQDGFGLSKGSWAARGLTAWSSPWPGATQGFRRGLPPLCLAAKGVQQPWAEPGLGSSSGNPSRDAETAGEFPPRGRGWGESNSSAEAGGGQDG